jgi:predicted transport protein
MSDIKLFKIDTDTVTQLQSKSVELEKSLQTQIEKYLETFLGVRFLASEYSTGKTHRGRIDTLGIDENNCPVIIEYKRAINQNIINQGLFYLDWLLDHKAEFKLLVMNKLGNEAAETIEWKFPRLICIAKDFSNYDSYAVQQMNRNIELFKYRKFDDNLLMFELVNAISGQEATADSADSLKANTSSKSISEILAEIQPPLSDRYEALRSFLLALGDDVQEKTLKFYVAFKRIKNFACVQVSTQKKTIIVYAKVNPESITLEEGFTRDARLFGHYGTGDLEIKIVTDDDLEKAKNLLIKSYENN